jgi:amino acid transporter
MNLFRRKNIHHILKAVEEGDAHSSLKKHLRVRDLTAFGIAAIIGAGIFSTIGQASASGGPGVIFLFIFTAIACGFAAFCYAEFASMVPVSGSAYTYSYVAFGELFAWIIGWALIMEYAIGNIVVAISWSGYFSSLLQHIHIPVFGLQNGIHLPEWSGIDYFSAQNAYNAAMANPADISLTNSEGYLAWIGAPVIGGLRVILDIPALVINVLITWLVYRGIKETRNASNIMVVIKLAVVALVIGCGFFYVNTANWSPFMPEGVGGILAGVSAVFFAYIGFDAISTTAEECHNPQRDLPRGMMYSIVICTVLYVLIALVLTGMVNYKELGVDDPLAFAFSHAGLNWISGIIAISAVVAMASVLLVFQMGQPRIWMSMSRDGLLPKQFAKVHPKFGTPGFSTIVTGLLVGIPILFTDMNTVVDLCSIGTLFAFILVCGGVLMLQNNKDLPRKFKVPFINGKIIVPALFILFVGYLSIYQATWFNENVNPLLNLDSTPMFIFFLVFLIMSIASFIKNLSLIPVLGLLTCLYLMAQIHIKNWIGFTVWLIIGLVIYFSYSYRHSKLNASNFAN